MIARSFSRVLHFLVAAVFFLLALSIARTAAAATTIPGGNVINQTWTPAGSPYIVQGDITIPNGAFLNINAGTEAQFTTTDSQAGGLDTSRVEVTVNGTLNVSGTSASQVIFKSQTSMSKAAWYGIVVNSGATAATIGYATISHATSGILSSAPGTVLSVSNTTVDTSTYGINL